MYRCVCIYRSQGSCEQLAGVGSQLNSVCQAWWWAPVLSESSCWPKILFKYHFRSFLRHHSAPTVAEVNFLETAFFPPRVILGVSIPSMEGATCKCCVAFIEESLFTLHREGIDRPKKWLYSSLALWSIELNWGFKGYGWRVTNMVAMSQEEATA